jgi:hypothetical protein
MGLLRRNKYFNLVTGQQWKGSILPYTHSWIVNADTRVGWDRCKGADPGFVGTEAYTTFGALFKKRNTKLQIYN